MSNIPQAMSQENARPSTSTSGKYNSLCSNNDMIYNILQDFVRYFVSDVETKLYYYNNILEGVLEKVGSFSVDFSEKIGQGIGAVSGGLTGLFFGCPAAGARIGTGSVGWVSKKLAKTVAKKKYTQKVTKEMNLINRFREDKSKFRLELVEAAVNIIYCLEMQFLRLTTDQGPKKAMQLLARDATNRLHNFYRQNKLAPNSISQAVFSGCSKTEPILGIPSTPKIKTPGFEVKYKTELCKKVWKTSEIFEKVGIVRWETQGDTPLYYEKKNGTCQTNKYGYRRLSPDESWEELQDDYKITHIKKNIENTDYMYYLNTENCSQLVESLLDEINASDTNLSEQRLKKIMEENKCEILEELSTLKFKNLSVEDRRTLQNMESYLKKLNFSVFLQEIKQSVIETGREVKECIVREGEKTNREVNHLSVIQFQHHRVNILEHNKTQEYLLSIYEQNEYLKKLLWNSGSILIIENFQFKATCPLDSSTIQEIELCAGIYGKSNFSFKTSFIEIYEYPIGDCSESGMYVLPSIQRILELRALHEAFKSSLSSQIVIYGQRGIGKTELVRQYIYFFSSYFDNNIIWINASSEDNLIKSFIELAKNGLKINIEHENDHERYISLIVEKVHKMFSNRNCLFVFDDVQGEYIDLFLPIFPMSYENKPRILITTCNQECYQGITQFEMKMFDNCKAVVEIIYEFQKTSKLNYSFCQCPFHDHDVFLKGLPFLVEQNTTKSVRLVMTCANKLRYMIPKNFRCGHEVPFQN